MTYVLDQANVGNDAGDGGGVSPDLTLTLDSNVASGARIFAAFAHDAGGDSTAGVGSISGGGLSWTTIGDAIDANSGGAMSFFTALAPSGLSIGTNLTYATTRPTIWAWQAVASSYTGTGWNQIGSFDTNLATSGTTWSSDSTALDGSSILIAASLGRQSTAHTASQGTEDQDRVASGYVNLVIVRRMESTTASFTVGGTWNATIDSGVTHTAAYKEDSGPPPDETKILRTVRSGVVFR